MKTKGLHARRKAKRKWGAVLFIFGLVPFATYLTESLIRKSGGLTVIAPWPSRQQFEVFTDEVGLSQSKPRDTLRVTILISTPVTALNWVPSSLPSRFAVGGMLLNWMQAPCYVERATTVVMEHNGLDGRVAPWTALSRTQQIDILRDHGGYLASQFRRSHRFDVSTDELQLARDVLIGGRIDSIDRRVLWLNIPGYATHRVPRFIAVPLTITMFAVGGSLWILGKRRLVDGACTHCGYDLSGTPHCDLCPECGTSTHEGYGPRASKG